MRRIKSKRSAGKKKVTATVIAATMRDKKNHQAYNDILLQLTSLFEDERKYTRQLWTVLQEIRMWGELRGVELPECALVNRSFYIDRHLHIQNRHRQIKSDLSKAASVMVGDTI